MHRVRGRAVGVDTTDHGGEAVQQSVQSLQRTEQVTDADLRRTGTLVGRQALGGGGSLPSIPPTP